MHSYGFYLPVWTAKKRKSYKALAIAEKKYGRPELSRITHGYSFRWLESFAGNDKVTWHLPAEHLPRMKRRNLDKIKVNKAWCSLSKWEWKPCSKQCQLRGLCPMGLVPSCLKVTSRMSPRTQKHHKCGHMLGLDAQRNETNLHFCERKSKPEYKNAAIL